MNTATIRNAVIGGIVLTLLILWASRNLDAAERITVRGAFVANGKVAITVTIDPRETDRHLYVTATSESNFESTYIQLEGLKSRTQYRLLNWKLVPDGPYNIEAIIRDGNDHITGHAVTSVMTMPPSGGPR